MSIPSRSRLGPLRHTAPAPATARALPAGWSLRRDRAAGYTIIELVAVLAVIGTLFGIFLPDFLEALRRGKLANMTADMRAIELQVSVYYDANQEYPQTLADLDIPTRRDAWGRPFVYLRIEDSTRGKWRKDRFLVPLNSDYDLYSVGPDGDSKPPLTAAASRDDIVRAGDGAYLGKAEDY